MADCSLHFYQAQQRRGVPSSGPEVGGSAAGRGREGGGVSPEPINSTLTKHLREISHAPLASCAENQRRGPPEKGIPSGQTANTAPDEGQHMALKETDFSRKLFNSVGELTKKRFRSRHLV